MRLAQLLRCTSEIFATLFLVCYMVPLVGVAFIPLGLFYVYIRQFFTATSCQLERLDHTGRSPILTHCSESLKGVSCIR